MTTVTYKVFCDSHKDPILSVSDETVQSAVFNWFKYRYIGFKDQSKFLDILQRNVAVNYPMYRQKLRIEPGVSQYDWLVQSYRERQLKSIGGTSNERIRGNDIVDTTGKTHRNDVNNINTEDDTRRNGTDIVTKNGNNDTNFTEGIHKDNTNFTEGVHTGNNTYTQGVHTQEVSPHVGQKTQNSGDSKDYNGNQSVAATLPMSKSYDGFHSIPTDKDGNFVPTSEDPGAYAKEGMPFTSKSSKEDKSGTKRSNLDWTTVSSQQQGTGRAYHNEDSSQETSYIYGKDGKGDITETKGDSKNPDTTKTRREGDKDNPDITSKIRQGDSKNPDVTTNNYHDETSTLYGTDFSTTHTGQTSLEGDTITTGKTTSQYGNINDTGRHNQTDQEIMAGRNEDPATILVRATAFIEQSSAFMWFKEQIDSCFYPGYYTDEDLNGNEIGGAFI